MRAATTTTASTSSCWTRFRPTPSACSNSAAPTAAWGAASGAAPGVSWWGVELMADAAATAAQFLDRVIQLDLDHADLTQLEGGFDVIVIGDLLEHVREPGRLAGIALRPRRRARRSSAARPTWRTCR